MPGRRNNKVETRFPTRGVPGGWRDPWEHDDSAELRAKAEAVELRQDAQAALIRQRTEDEAARFALRLQGAGR